MVGQYAFVFPGQGSQSIGMGRALYDAFPTAREVFGEVDDALKQHLTKLVFEGTPEELTQTENAQPALMAVSIAVLRVLEREAGLRLADRARVVAGHSLGEYSALCAAGVVGVGDVARLLKARGQAMQKAVPQGEGGMAALISVTPDDAREICVTACAQLPDPTDRVLEVANDNGGGQVVISGRKAAIDAALICARERGVKRAVLLPVSAPFHCSLMQPAADVMQDVLAGQDFSTPSVPVIPNVTAQEETDPTRLKALLVTQVTGAVRWRETMESLAGKDITSVVELGAGKVLTGLSKRIAPDLATHNVSTPEDIEALMRAL